MRRAIYHNVEDGSEVKNKIATKKEKTNHNSINSVSESHRKREREVWSGKKKKRRACTNLHVIKCFCTIELSFMMSDVFMRVD